MTTINLRTQRKYRRPDPKEDWSPRQVRSFRRMIIEGFEAADIAERFGIGPDDVKKTAKLLGLKVSSRLGSAEFKRAVWASGSPKAAGAACDAIVESGTE